MERVDQDLEVDHLPGKEVLSEIDLQNTEIETNTTEMVVKVDAKAAEVEKEASAGTEMTKEKISMITKEESGTMRMSTYVTRMMSRNLRLFYCL